MRSVAGVLAITCIAVVFAGGCANGDDDGRATVDVGPAAGVVTASCDPDQDVLAVTLNGDAEGLPEVAVARDRGGAAVVTGNWVATEPSLAPGGRRLVVVRADGDYESAGPEATTLWVMETDGSNPLPLTAGPLDDEPHWAPDGTSIAFSRSDRYGARRIMVVDADGGEPRPLLSSGAEGSADDHAPAWSPDGEEIAWIRSEPRLGAGSVWVANADGSDARQSTQVPGAHTLDWHPDGQSMLVSGYGGSPDVMLLDVASGDLQVLGPGLFATWSADGSAVYYLTHEGASQPDSWRLAVGRITNGGLELEQLVPGVEEYYFAYPELGISVGRCPR
jgi:Tol biopolymer transport system component